MVKKLFKHEIFAYLRTVIPLYIALLGVALCGRIIQFFENDSIAFDIIMGASVTVYAVTAIATLLLTFVFVVVRFYKNMYTGEGYLTFTLPVTVSQHITVKLFVALLFQFLSIIGVLLSVAVITFGELFTEIIKALSYLIKMFTENMGYHLWLFAIEFLVALVFLFIYEYMVYYTCISIGQLSRKNRIISAIGVYFAYYIITQIIGTIIVVLVTLLENSSIVENVIQFIERHHYATAHIVACGAILFMSIISAVLFFVNRSIMTKKLNLE